MRFRDNIFKSLCYNILNKTIIIIKIYLPMHSLLSEKNHSTDTKMLTVVMLAVLFKNFLFLYIFQFSIVNMHYLCNTGLKSTK